MTPLSGIVPVMVTPMHEDGSPDGDGIAKLVDHVVANGVGGLWVLGSTGEDINTGTADRIATVKMVDAANQGRVPIITGTGLTASADILRFIDKIEGCNIAGVHVLYLDPKQSDRQMVAQMVQIADASAFPIWLYHNPKRGKPVSRAAIRELRDHPNIRGMKVGGYSLTEMTQALLLATPTFEVIGAGGGQFFMMLCLGAKAHTASEACSRPDEFAKIYDAFASGDLEKARERQFALIKFNQSYPRTAFLDNGESSAEEKFILSLRGICSEHVNPSYRGLTEKEKSAIGDALRAAGYNWV